MSKTIPYRLEFHVSGQSRDYYDFDDLFFAYNGQVIFANIRAARIFAQKMNNKKDLVRFPEQAARAGQINAMALIDEILHMVLESYRQQQNPNILDEALDWLNAQVGDDQVDQALLNFAGNFPQNLVYRGQISLQDFLEGESLRPDGKRVPNRHLVLEEMLMLWLANMNPAYQRYLELFDDEKLEKLTAYPEVIKGLYAFFADQAPFGPENQNLIDMLRAPALASPDSLTGQLEFIRSRWSSVLGAALLRLLLLSLDMVREEEKMRFAFPPAGAGGEAFVPEFGGQEFEPEAFSQDLYWMPRLVLIAKNSFVWLDQLSKKYRRSITHLDQIPDEELDTLSRWGVTGLWLIGLWERSLASKTIKQLRGNPEAVASAYSLMDYSIAQDLGGEQAYQDLRQRAWKRGIRLASDMVPNHMGIDSRWVIEHPDWFISLDYPPFPAYTFNGPNLSWDNRVGIYLEDHYYDNSDAAVVFKRVDFWTGSEKFIYHGNDGTSFPWNDTAQLNYLLPEVREAVIQTILEVARRFPIIRFDAAMTLAKRHYSRLWFPEPGKGGDIPSRAEFALTKEQFDAAFPEEFWREVVDRVAQEAPDTLLLAEAFWLMEGYFVRTLGMHRVYNSAFMNMLRDEKNQEYRLVIKNTLEFEPEILKRYVNFMNNPDEKTAVEQFGKGDKYFGVLVMLVTNPGLPMIGHGQIEGYAEKYGMEYRRAYYDETPDEWLVQRHEREIFPLLRKRYLFAEVKDFLLYDFYTPEGYVNEDVYAYTNRAGDERALVIYHNKYAETQGWIRISTAYPVKGEGDQRQVIHKSLGEGLGLPNDPNSYIIYRDQISGLEFLRNCQELHNQGLFFQLKAYQYHVYLDFRIVQDDHQGQYARLAAHLQGHGTPSMQEALQELNLRDLLIPYRELVNSGWYRWVIDHRLTDLPQDALTPEQAQSEPDAESTTQAATPPDQEAHTFPFDLPEFSHKRLIKAEPVLEECAAKALRVFQEVQALTRDEEGTLEPGDPELATRQTCLDLASTLNLPVLQDWISEVEQPRKLAAALSYLQDGPGGGQEIAGDQSVLWGTLLSWVFNHRLSQVAYPENDPLQNRLWMDEWLLGKINRLTLEGLGLDPGRAHYQVDILKLLLEHQDWFKPAKRKKVSASQVLENWLSDPALQQFLKTNRYQGILWFNKESFEELLWWMYAIAVIQINSEMVARDMPADQSVAAIVECYTLVSKLRKAEEKSDYQVEKLVEATKS